MRILLVEDDVQIASYLVGGLTEQGHVCDHVADGRDGLFQLSSAVYDVAVIDRMLPTMDGIELIKSLRASGNMTPLLILSALGDVDHRVEGLRAGGDDYLVKPFAFSELLARLDILARRRLLSSVPETKLFAGDLEMDLLARTVTRAGQVLDIQAREFRLLEFLLRHKGQVVTRTLLLEGVWDYHFDPQTNVIDVHISRLRSKIDKGFSTPLIKTVRSAGYIIQA